MRLLAATLILAVVSTAAPAKAKRDPEAELAKIVGTRVPGKPQSCISSGRGRPSTTIDKLGIVYDAGATLYLNRFLGGCPLLGWDRIIVTQSTTGQLCRGDIVRIVSRTPAIEMGSCSFDNFIPYTRVK